MIDFEEAKEELDKASRAELVENNRKRVAKTIADACKGMSKEEYIDFMKLLFPDAALVYESMSRLEREFVLEEKQLPIRHVKGKLPGEKRNIKRKKGR